ncbi:amino acid ABC transporter permease [Clostridium tyrobutyricum]|uniref:amino acid ABC transporter permease n=1 Tax=Clostridium tyrobutyricum TaxID=1519 RepID=UPI0011CA7DC3|nr:amino acid ABC transporter permease [Clostridium tyrobutyricum]
MKFDIVYFLKAFPDLIRYVHYTISMSVISTIIGFVIASGLVALKLMHIKILTKIINVYISFFRGTPLLVQLFIFYYGVPQLISPLKNISPFQAMLVGLSLCGSAYMAEIIRGAIESVPKGQMEAALSIGMTPMQAFKRIIYPQAIRIAIPGIGNEFVDLLKSSSLAFVLGLTEILARAQMDAASSFKVLESYLALAITYWILVEIFNFLQRLIEKKLAKAYK